MVYFFPSSVIYLAGCSILKILSFEIHRHLFSFRCSSCGKTGGGRRMVIRHDMAMLLMKNSAMQIIYNREFSCFKDRAGNVQLL